MVDPAVTCCYMLQLFIATGYMLVPDQWGGGRRSTSKNGGMATRVTLDENGNACLIMATAIDAEQVIRF